MTPDNWAYWWNKPRPAIEYPPELLYSGERDRQLFIERLIKAQQLINDLPKFLKVIINKKLDDIEISSGLKAANSHLINNIARRSIPRIKSVNDNYLLTDSFATNELRYKFNQLPDLNKDDRNQLAFDISLAINSEIILICDESETTSPATLALDNYQRIAHITQQFKQQPPQFDLFIKNKLSADAAITALMRMSDQKWWERKLNRYAEQWREHLFIAFGSVSKKTSPYCSFIAKQEWKEQRKRNKSYLEFMELEDEDGNRISLIDKYNGSNANPEIRRYEMMARIRGFENISLEMGYNADFYTLTAPSKYHATTNAGYKNHKWQCFNPAQTQRYLCGVWSKVRAKLAREGLPIFGIRVAEPHHDATPHWHMLIFMKSDHVERIREIITQYATEEDTHELSSKKALNARILIKPIDPEKGSATGYVAKYISKNIDGYALDGETCNETGEQLKDTAAAAMAWASRWRIRQFQFIGGAPVTIYRELRRMADSDTAKALDLDFAKVHDAADDGNFAEYIKAQGGPFVKRADLIVKMEYVIEETPNEYGESVKKIYGVSCTFVDGSPIRTRVKKWKIVRPHDSADDVDLKGAFAPSRSSVNNCTQGHDSDQRQRLSMLLKSRGIEPDKLEIDCLLRGSTVDFGYNMELQLVNNELVELNCARNYW